MSAAATRIASPARSTSGMSIGLWIAQVVLFAVFASAGFMKLTQPLDALATMLPWTAEVPAALVRFIGLSELLGALGVVLPAATRVRPGLTPLAALGLVVVMALAAGFHVMRGEIATIAPSVILGALAGFVAWGRARKAPIVLRTSTIDRAGAAPRTTLYPKRLDR